MQATRRLLITNRLSLLYRFYRRNKPTRDVRRTREKRVNHEPEARNLLGLTTEYPATPKHIWNMWLRGYADTRLEAKLGAFVHYAYFSTWKKARYTRI